MDIKTAEKLEELTNKLATNVLNYLPGDIPRKLRISISRFYFCVPAQLKEKPYSLNGNAFNYKYIEEAIKLINNKDKERASSFLSSYKLIKKIIKSKSLL